MELVNIRELEHQYLFIVRCLLVIMADGSEEERIVAVPDSPIAENLPLKEPVEKPEKPQKTQEKPLYAYVSHAEWFQKVGWKNNPFTFSINPLLLVGYKVQTDSLMAALGEKQKITLVIGPTGSGKTSLLSWISRNAPSGYDYVFISKPPSKEELVEIFSEKFKPPWFLRPFIPDIKNIYGLPEFLNRKLKNRNMVVLFDECHEANTDTLEWIRVLSDQVENMQIIMSGLPVFEAQIRDRLETLRKRIAVRLEVLYLTKEEMREMIKRRIENAGGSDVRPFTEETVNALYNRTAGFPRETIRLCNELVNRAALEGKYEITPDMMEAKPAEEKEISLTTIEDMTPMQKWIIDFLTRKPSSPGGMADNLDLGKYKSRQHAVRSMNNVLKKMFAEGIVERERKERAFIYHLSPKFRTLAVRA